MASWLDKIPGGDILKQIPLDGAIDWTKGLFSDDDAKEGIKEIRDIVKDDDLKADLEELGVDVEGAGRRVSAEEAVERMGPLAEKLLDAGKLDDGILDDDEKFDTSVAALKSALDSKGVAAFDKLSEAQQEALIVLVATPNDERMKAIQEAALDSRTAAPEADMGDEATPTRPQASLDGDASFAETMDDQQVAQNGDIDVDWNEGAAQLSDNFGDNAGTPYVEPGEPAPAVEVDNTFKV